METKILGIDIGGTNLRGGIVDINANITDRKKIYSGADEGISALIDNLTGFINTFLSKNRLSTVSIGIPGIVDSKHGILTQAPNIRDVDNYPIKENLEKRLGKDITVHLENDANCACMGEFWTGSGKGSGSMVMLTIGTGLGGGIVINGELWRGEDGMGGEIGHIIIDPDGPDCSCGSNGCLESFVSARALYRTAKEKPEYSSRFSDKKYHEVPLELMELARQGEPDALDIWKETGINLGIGLTTVINLLNVEKVVIGGGISNAWDLFIEYARKELLRRGLRAPVKRVSIQKGTLGDNAGIMGAAFLTFRQTGMSR